MGKLTYGRVSTLEAVSGILDLFVYAEQHWCQWDKLEEAIAEVDYELFSDEYLEWFIEFVANAVLRVWYTRKEDAELNRVKEQDGCFYIRNYDWNAFKFGKQHGLDKQLLTKEVFILNGNSLTEREIEMLRSKCK